MTTVNIPIMQQTLYDKYLKPSGWGDKLKTFLLSEDFKSVLEYLVAESGSGKKFTPVLKQVFRGFQECPYEELKVIIVNTEPYCGAGIADGIAFSCANTDKVQSSLQHIFKELERTVYPDGMRWDPDLKRWSNQGVLMLNTSLTTQIGNPGTHAELWKPFMAFLFDMLAHYNSGLIYVFMGKDAKEWAKMVPVNNYKMFTIHPAFAAYTDSEWNSGGVFNQINKILNQNQNTEITW